jgi:release factor glutamine methyltransferase
LTRGEALREAAARLTEAGVSDARLDAEWLLARALDVPRLEMLLNRGREAEAGALSRFFDDISRRAVREPLQYILGEAAFMGREFFVEPGVLIPRADTETLLLRALERAGPGMLALDLCCGSGCLGISLKLAQRNVRVICSDLSPQAVRISRDNAARLEADIEVRQGDLFAPLAGLVFDLILVNPPYIPTGVLPGLQPEVLREPALALDGGEDGLRFYRRLMVEAPAFLSPGGFMLMEIGDSQAEAVNALRPGCLVAFTTYPDLAGRPRVLETSKVKDVH